MASRRDDKMAVYKEGQFDFEKFEADLRTACGERDTTIYEISENVILHNNTYIKNCIYRKSMPQVVAKALCNWMEADVKEYLIKKKKPVKEPEPAEATPAEAASETSGWTCEIKVYEEAGLIRMSVFKNGEEIANARCLTHGDHDEGIMQGISYAAHQCYKMYQQTKTERIEKKIIEKQMSPESGTDLSNFKRIVFKDWIIRYEDANSRFGNLARWIKDRYDKFPATGKKDMRAFILMNKGDVHLETFDMAFGMYLKWDNAQRVNADAELTMR